MIAIPVPFCRLAGPAVFIRQPFLFLVVRLTDQEMDHGLSEEDIACSAFYPGSAFVIGESPEDVVPSGDVPAGEEDAESVDPIAIIVLIFPTALPSSSKSKGSGLQTKKSPMTS